MPRDLLAWRVSTQARRPYRKERPRWDGGVLACEGNGAGHARVQGAGDRSPLLSAIATGTPDGSLMIHAGPKAHNLQA
jgi:hypothetical protein